MPQRRFRTTLASVVAVAAIATSAAVFAELTLYSYPVDGWQYAHRITEDAIAKSPRWCKSADNPPLSARKALQLADAHTDKTIKPNDKLRRELQSLSLIPVGERWAWRATYNWFPKVGGFGGEPHNFIVVVLMDGSVIVPSREKRQNELFLIHR